MAADIDPRCEEDRDMSERPLAASWVAWTAAVAACVLLALGGWMDANTSGYETSGAIDWTTGVVGVVAAAGIGVVLATRRGDNPIGWLLLALALLLGHYALTEGYVSFSLARGGSLPAERVVANWDRGSWALIFAPVVAIVFMFPEGPPPIRRWRLVRWVGILSFSLVIVAETLTGSPLNAPFDDLEPYSILPSGVSGLMLVVGLVAMVATFGLAAWSIRRRFRDADPVTKAQLKWLVYASSLVPLSILTGVVEVALSSSAEPGAVTLALVFVLLIVLPGAIGFALLRYRLFDIEIVIRRTLVYGTLTLLVAAAYVGLVAGLAAVLGERGVAGVIAAGTVAVAVQPLRERIQRGVDRWLYGYRSDPYLAMRMLGDRLHATLAPDQVLETIVVSVAEALRVPYVAVEFTRGDASELAATHGTLGRATPERRPLDYRGEHVAELVIGVPAGRELTTADLRLLDDLAVQAGVAVYAVRLTADLQHSRERLVTAREEERRRVRRDLHDGLGPTLASAVLSLDASRRAVAVDPVHADRLLTELRTQMQDAIADVRRLVYELRPPALDQFGLVGALREYATRIDTGNGGLKVSIEAPRPLPALPAAVEVAAYRIAMEAINNTIRHAEARRCTVQFDFEDQLELEIADDGRGVPPDSMSGIGMQSMRERAAELGGTLTVGNRAGGGTSVMARLPVVTP
jgi:two-component system, NarL family, sensor kinase